jgi:hypothetical protein
MRPLSLAQAKLLQLARDGHVLAELQRREVERWLAEDDGGMSLLVGLLGRLKTELDRAEMADGPEPDSTEAAEVIAQFEEMIAEVEGLLEKLKAMDALGADEAEGVECRGVVQRVRPPPEVERPTPKRPSPSPRVQRSRPDPVPLDLSGVKIGVVESWDQRTWIGSIRWGYEEIVIPTRSIRLAGLTNLFAGQRCEFTIVLGPDGRKEAENLKLIVQSDRAAVATYQGGIRDNSVYRRYFGMPR